MSKNDAAVIVDMVYIGIDPGVSGGLSLLDERGRVLDARAMPETERDLVELLRTYAGWGGDASKHKWISCRAMLERVGATPQMGTVSAFTFGRNRGAILMALTAEAIPFDEVTPKIWQQALGCLTGGDKNITKRRAQQLFPRRTITLAIADALLIAEYGRRLHTGKIQPRQPKRGRSGHGEKDTPNTAGEQTGEGQGAGALEELQAGEFEAWQADRARQADASRHRAGTRRRPAAGATVPNVARDGARS